MSCASVNKSALNALKSILELDDDVKKLLLNRYLNPVFDVSSRVLDLKAVDITLGATGWIIDTANVESNESICVYAVVLVCDAAVSAEIRGYNGSAYQEFIGPTYHGGQGEGLLLVLILRII